MVAERAGVSRATASRVLRGSTRVSPETRDAVLRAAGEVSYTPNRAARALATRRTDSVAFFVAESEDRLFSDPFFLPVLRGAQLEVGAAGLQLVFAVAPSRPEAAQFEHYVAAGHVDGVLLLSLHGDDDLPRHLERAGVPTVLAGRPLSGGDDIHSVDVDNVSGAVRATELLLERGCRRLVTVAGPADMSVGQDRLAGFRRALEAAGLPADPGAVEVADFSADDAERAMTVLLSRRPDLDGVVVASDLMARGALHALAAANRWVPAEVAVVGFDDSPEARLARPALTTVRQPLEELGRTMARVLLDRLEGRDVERRVVLPTTLVRRESA